MTLEDINRLDKEAAKSELMKCCGSVTWASEMINCSPFISEEDLHNKATEIWYNECSEKDWLEAFQNHPKIGDVKNLHEKFAATKHWAGSEQAAVQVADTTIIEELAKYNKEYEEKFGFIFIVCATGKTAEEMLDLLKNRINNSYEGELKIAMEEQNKITHIRLKKLLS
jgi:OHCU decarboxylase